MASTDEMAPQTLARWVGWSLLGSIIIGVFAALYLGQGIDINQSADVALTAQNMLAAEQQLRGSAYVGALLFGLEVLIGLGFFFLLRGSGQLLAAWSLFVGLAASTLVLLGSVFALNAAEIAGDIAYVGMPTETRLMLSGLQATSDYTSFHLGLVISSLSKAGFFYLFLKSGLISRIIAGWGLFASLLVASIVVGRDFIPMLGNGTITVGFLAANFIAIVATALYLIIRGVRTSG
jgi:hypothetical protein